MCVCVCVRVCVDMYDSARVCVQVCSCGCVWVRVLDGVGGFCVRSCSAGYLKPPRHRLCSGLTAVAAEVSGQLGLDIDQAGLWQSRLGHTLTHSHTHTHTHTCTRIHTHLDE